MDVWKLLVTFNGQRLVPNAEATGEWKPHHWLHRHQGNDFGVLKLDVRSWSGRWRTIKPKSRTVHFELLFIVAWRLDD